MIQIGDKVRVDDEPGYDTSYEALVIPDDPNDLENPTITVSQANQNYSIASVHLVARHFYPTDKDIEVLSQVAANGIVTRNDQEQLRSMFARMTNKCEFCNGIGCPDCPNLSNLLPLGAEEGHPL